MAPKNCEPAVVVTIAEMMSQYIISSPNILDDEGSSTTTRIAYRHINKNY